jgi:hypothetical protein
MKISSERISFVFFLLSVAFLAFGYGIAVDKYQLYPYGLIRDAFNEVERLLGPPHHLWPRRYKSVGAKVYDRELITPGVTLLVSYWPETDWQPGIRIVDVDGNKLHQWNVNPADIWPESPYNDTFAGTKNRADNYIHGSYLFRNGDVLLNIEYLGLVRLDACGNVVWKLPYRTHHSISRAEDGNFWVCGLKWVESGTERASEFPGLRPPFAEETALKVSPDGEIIREISLLKAIFDGGYQRLFFKCQQLEGDVTHLNDVEALTVEAAEGFPSFEAGDLVVSFKHISSVAVLDQTGKIKWLESEPFVFQHDPDFQDDGWITVFDNRSDGSVTGQYLGGSVISAINPSSGEVHQIYPTAKSQFFYSNGAGKHQRLHNGNRLITESRAGRVFEVASSGRTVWEWIQQPYDAELVPEVLEGSRYDIPPEVVAGWACK